eukprot:GHVU01136554.1.p1 GENE.GHVU01136554.1~~GHVU01136554.1.p1  ORF type:complete len:401 (+),score=17.85 GHVU01136554.1:249-1451(+)
MTENWAARLRKDNLPRMSSSFGEMAFNEWVKKSPSSWPDNNQLYIRNESEIRRVFNPFEYEDRILTPSKIIIIETVDALNTQCNTFLEKCAVHAFSFVYVDYEYEIVNECFHGQEVCIRGKVKPKKGYFALSLMQIILPKTRQIFILDFKKIRDNLSGRCSCNANSNTMCDRCAIIGPFVRFMRSPIFKISYGGMENDVEALKSICGVGLGRNSTMIDILEKIRLVKKDAIDLIKTLRHPQLDITTINWDKDGLETFVNVIFNRDLPKPKDVRGASWGYRPLTVNQMLYAALDPSAVMFGVEAMRNRSPKDTVSSVAELLKWIINPTAYALQQMSTWGSSDRMVLGREYMVSREAERLGTYPAMDVICGDVVPINGIKKLSHNQRKRANKANRILLAMDK